MIVDGKPTEGCGEVRERSGATPVDSSRGVGVAVEGIGQTFAQGNEGIRKRRSHRSGRVRVGCGVGEGVEVVGHGVELVVKEVGGASGIDRIWAVGDGVRCRDGRGAVLVSGRVNSGAGDITLGHNAAKVTAPCPPPSPFAASHTRNTLSCLILPGYSLAFSAGPSMRGLHASHVGPGTAYG